MEQPTTALHRAWINVLTHPDQIGSELWKKGVRDFPARDFTAQEIGGIVEAAMSSSQYRDPEDFLTNAYPHVARLIPRMGREYRDRFTQNFLPILKNSEKIGTPIWEKTLQAISPNWRDAEDILAFTTEHLRPEAKKSPIFDTKILPWATLLLEKSDPGKKMKLMYDLFDSIDLKNVDLESLHYSVQAARLTNEEQTKFCEKYGLKNDGSSLSLTEERLRNLGLNPVEPSAPNPSKTPSQWKTGHGGVLGEFGRFNGPIPSELNFDSDVLKKYPHEHQQALREHAARELHSAREHIKKGEYQEAIDKLEPISRGIKEYPDDKVKIEKGFIHGVLGIAHARLGEHEKALPYFKDAFSSGQQLLEEHEYAASRSMLNPVAVYSHDTCLRGNAHVGMGLASYYLDDRETAFKHFENGLSCGESLVKSKSHSEAIEMLSPLANALEAYPEKKLEQAIAHHTLFIAHHYVQDNAKAFEHLKHASVDSSQSELRKKKPDLLWGSKFYEAEALENQGEVREASQSYQQFLELCDEFKTESDGEVHWVTTLQAHRHLGKQALKRGDHHRVERHFSESLRAYDHLPKTVENQIKRLECQSEYSRSLWQQKKHDLAIDSLRAGLDAHPPGLRHRSKWREEKRNLALCLKSTGKMQESLACYQELLHHSGHDPVSSMKIQVEAGNLAFSVCHVKESRKYFEDAQCSAEKYPGICKMYPMLELDIFSGNATSSYHMGDWKNADRFFKRFFEDLSKNQDRIILPPALTHSLPTYSFFHGYAQRELGQSKEAIRSFENCISSCEVQAPNQRQKMEIQAHQHLAELWKEEGDEARNHYHLAKKSQIENDHEEADREFHRTLFSLKKKEQVSALSLQDEGLKANALFDRIDSLEKLHWHDEVLTATRQAATLCSENSQRWRQANHRIGRELQRKGESIEHPADKIVYENAQRECRESFVFFQKAQFPGTLFHEALQGFDPAQADIGMATLSKAISGLAWATDHETREEACDVLKTMLEDKHYSQNEEKIRPYAYMSLAYGLYQNGKNEQAKQFFETGRQLIRQNPRLFAQRPALDRFVEQHETLLGSSHAHAHSAQENTRPAISSR